MYMGSIVSRNWVNHCNVCVKLKFNDESLHTKNDSECRVII